MEWRIEQDHTLKDVSADDAAGILIYRNFFQKAEPLVEKDRRYCWCMASDEDDIDLDQERVLRKALQEYKKYYLSRGNVDLDHITKIGHKVGIENPHLFEIGLPVEVNFQGPKTFLKVEIYQGDGVAAKKANFWWDSMTNCKPPQRWFPSIAGTVLRAEKEVDSNSGNIVRVIKGVRWNNTAFAKEPVCQSVPQVALHEITKSLLFMEFGSKALEAGSSAGATTDVAALQGGEAIRRESLDAELKERVVQLRGGFKEGKFPHLKNGLASIRNRNTLKTMYESVGYTPVEARRLAKKDFNQIRQWKEKQ